MISSGRKKVPMDNLINVSGGSTAVPIAAAWTERALQSQGMKVVHMLVQVLLQRQVPKETLWSNNILYAKRRVCVCAARAIRDEARCSRTHRLRKTAPFAIPLPSKPFTTCRLASIRDNIFCSNQGLCE